MAFGEAGAEDALGLDATAQLELLAARAISARELLAAAVARADRMGPRVNAVVARDLPRAFAEADAIDARRARGEPMGRLAGLPMTVKDALDVEGLPAAAGVAGLRDRACADAEVVRRVRAEGAVVWGKTNTPVLSSDWQTSNPLYGVTRNPWDPSRTPGGSSGGSAAALAARITALEIGADIAGSLRIPAGFCGVCALKPTYGLVPQEGLAPPLPDGRELDLAVVGPMARSARDLRLLISLIGEPGLQAAPPLAGLKVGLWLDEPAFALDPQVRAVVAGFADRLSASGAVVEPVEAPADPRALMAAYAILLFSASAPWLPAGQRRAFELLRGPAKLARALGAGPLSWAQGVLGYTARPAEWAAADAARRGFQAALAAWFGRFDVLLSPVAAVPAFPHDDRPVQLRRLALSDGGSIPYLRLMEWVALPTVCGLPAVAVPAGRTPARLPVGAQLVGPANSDLRLVAIAEAIEAALGAAPAPPEP